MSAAAIANAVAHVFEQSGWHPAYVFAIRQCGFILTTGNLHLFTEEDIDEWEQALDRWFDMHPDAPPLSAPRPTNHE